MDKLLQNLILLFCKTRDHGAIEYFKLFVQKWDNVGAANALNQIIFQNLLNDVESI